MKSYKEIQTKHGRKGGKSTFKKYGRDHMIALGKRSAKARAKKRKASLSAKT